MRKICRQKYICIFNVAQFADLLEALFTKVSQESLQYLM